MSKQFDEKKAIIFAISSEGSEQLKKMRETEKLGSTFVFLSDPDAKLASLYAGRYPQGFLKPATIVIGLDKKVAWATSVEDYKVRPAAEKVLAALGK